MPERSRGQRVTCASVGRIRVVSVFVLAGALAAGACSGGGGGSSDGDRAKPKEGEVFLEPLGEVGANAFTKSVAVAPVPAITATNAAGAPSGQGLRSVRGTTSGLYGGSGSQQVCDPTAAVAFLLDNDDKAQAWVDALNADSTLAWSGGSKLAVDDIAAYVGELTSVFLQADTRVTNHGFKNGRSTVFQSVLQRGTAVMVDSRGVPRARCACFNPLTKPLPASAAKYRGEKWDEFDQTKLVIVTPGTPTEDAADRRHPHQGDHRDLRRAGMSVRPHQTVDDNHNADEDDDDHDGAKRHDNDGQEDDHDVTEADYDDDGGADYHDRADDDDPGARGLLFSVLDAAA